MPGDSAHIRNPQWGILVLHSAPASAVSTLTNVNMEEIKQLLQQETDFGSPQASLLRQAANKYQSHLLRLEINALRTAVESASKVSDNTLAKLGLGLFLLAQPQSAYQYLKQTSKHPVATFVMGETCMSLNLVAEAIDHFASAAKLGFDPINSELNRVGALRLEKKLDEAEKALKAIAAKAVSRADYSFQMGCILADRGDTFGAVEYFERAIDMDPFHGKALFWLANENSRQGNDEEAITLLERSLSRPPYLIGALLNLGLLYEDVDKPQAAAFCFKRVLEHDPNNERARLYLKDIDANEGMFFDEDAARDESRMRQTLARPLSDFEISVRSRNCLVRLNLNTLGDMTRISEPELLASRNFGETSLKELRELLAQNNLTIGQNVHSAKVEPGFSVPSDLAPEQRAAMDMTIADLNLSVRARKCMQRLNIIVVSELLARTPDELLGTRNFGVTSLNEIRAKLEEFGLALRND